MNDLEKYFQASKKAQAKQAEAHRKPRVQTQKEKMALKMAHRADPHWDMADRPSKTKGYKIYEQNK